MPDQQAPEEHRAQPLAQGIGVRGVDEEVVGDQEAAVRPPGVHAEAPFAPDAGQVGAVQDLEHEPEALLQLRPPLLEHGGGSRNHDCLGLLPQEEFTGNQAGLDGLPEAGVIRDEQVDPGKPERLAEGLHLVGVNLDARAKGGLKEIGIRGRDTVPPEGVKEGCKVPGRVKTPCRKILPSLFLQNPAVELVLPKNFQGLALGIVVGAGQSDDSPTGRRGGRNHLLHQPPA
jgi:hypothetical protein